MKPVTMQMCKFADGDDVCVQIVNRQEQGDRQRLVNVASAVEQGSVELTKGGKIIITGSRTPLNCAG
jgi:hypothetical protein